MSTPSQKNAGTLAALLMLVAASIGLLALVAMVMPAALGVIAVGVGFALCIVIHYVVWGWWLSNRLGPPTDDTASPAIASASELRGNETASGDLR